MALAPAWPARHKPRLHATAHTLHIHAASVGRRRHLAAAGRQQLLRQDTRAHLPRAMNMCMACATCRPQEATGLAQRCISRSKDRGMSRYGGCRVAASVLTKVRAAAGPPASQLAWHSPQHVFWAVGCPG